MKTYALILSFLLSLFSWGGFDAVDPVQAAQRKDSLTAGPVEQTTDFTQNQELCFFASQGYSISGGNGSQSVGVRVSPSGRRTSSQTKSPFRMVKAGKMIDNNHSYPFLTQSFERSSGLYISERYLFDLCRLRL